MANLLVMALNGCYSTLIYGDGKQFKTEFHGARLLGELPAAAGGSPILVISGRPGQPCELVTGCDPKTSVYFQATSDGPKNWYGYPLRLPGDYYATETGKLAARVRMFIGRCLDEREGVAWFVEANDDRPNQPRFVSESQVFLESIVGDESSVKYGGGLWVSDFPADTDIAIARAAVFKRACREISSQATFYKSSDEYRSLGWRPDVELSLTGSKPSIHVKQWIKYFITLANTFEVVFFAPENFKTSAHGNELLIVLARPDYDRVSALSRSQPCLKPLPSDFRGGGYIVERNQDSTTECILAPPAACDYLTAVFSLADAHWMPEQLAKFHRLFSGTRCKNSESPGRQP